MFRPGYCRRFVVRLRDESRRVRGLYPGERLTAEPEAERRATVLRIAGSGVEVGAVSWDEGPEAGDPDQAV